MRTAYLLAFVDTTQTPPIFVGAGIYSEDEGSITTEQRRARAVRLSEVNASTYQEAHDLMLWYVEQPWNEWIRKLPGRW